MIYICYMKTVIKIVHVFTATATHYQSLHCSRHASQDLLYSLSAGTR